MSDQRFEEGTGRLLPVIYPEEQPYWEAARKEKLILQRCNDCGNCWYPVGPVCPKCLSNDFRWDEMSGNGIVRGLVVYHKAFNPWFADKLPYAVALVELPEGPRLTTNLRGISPEEASIGLPVQATYEHVNAEVSLVQFTPA